jgi:hypothetical protein
LNQLKKELNEINNLINNHVKYFINFLLINRTFLFSKNLLIFHNYQLKVLNY